MIEKNENITVVSTIDIDQNTSEPIIRPLSKKELKKIREMEKKDVAKDYHEHDFVAKKTDRSIGKQLAMERVLGIKKEDDSNISKRQKILKYSFTIIFIVFVIGVLAYTFYNDFFASDKEFPTWAEIWDTISGCWWYVIFGLIAVFLNLFFKASKLSIMAKSMTGKAHFKTCFETAIIGCYYNNVTPLAVGGQPFEIYHLAKHGVHGGIASSLPIATFFLNQFAFVILSIVSLTLYMVNSFGAPDAILTALPPSLFYTLAIIGILCCLLMPLMVVLFCIFPSVSAGLVKLLVKLGTKFHFIKNPELAFYKTLKNVIHNSKCIKKIAKSFWVLSSATILSFFEQLALISTAYFALRSFGFDLPQNGFQEWLIICQLSFILLAAVSFIPTPGNSGAADLSFYALFSACITTAGLAFASMLLWRFLCFYSFIILGFVFASLKKKSDARKKARTQLTD